MADHTQREHFVAIEGLLRAMGLSARTLVLAGTRDGGEVYGIEVKLPDRLQVIWANHSVDDVESGWRYSTLDNGKVVGWGQGIAAEDLDVEAMARIIASWPYTEVVTVEEGLALVQKLVSGDLDVGSPQD